jgi:hypothetical protein
MQMFYPNAPKFVVCAAMLCSVPAWVGAGPVADLETLFYTPAERQAMTLRRSGQEGDAGVIATRLTGVVHRAGGKGTVWVNGKAYPEGSPGTGAIKGVDAVVDGRRLRVGEGIDTATGARVDVVTPGAVTPRRKP